MEKKEESEKKRTIGRSKPIIDQGKIHFFVEPIRQNFVFSGQPSKLEIFDKNKWIDGFNV